ncbi:MAG: hypothetical protein Q9208_001420 [Pyrenodesmia sp. 3 TL-2023]
MAPRLMATFNFCPKEMFRLTNTLPFRIRHLPLRPPPGTPFDLITENGLVKPKALSPNTYEFPNGFSLRTNDKRQQQLVRNRGKSVLIFRIPEETEVPEDLILVQDTEHHYSLQPAKEMTVDEFNATINEFITSEGQTMTQEQWIAKYPWRWAEA